MPLNEAHISRIARDILNQKGRAEDRFSLSGLAYALMYKMMDNDAFRVAALRFTDVAPTLTNDDDFVAHLNSYFDGVGGLASFVGESMPGSKMIGKIIAPMAKRNIVMMAKMFIAGETLDDGLKSFKALHKNGIACSLDVLGEAVITKEEAEGFTHAYLDAIARISQAANSWDRPSYPEEDAIGPIARANVSIKLSALYEHVNVAAYAHTKAQLCERFRTLLHAAMKHGTFINVDMEQFELLPLTLDVFESVLMEDDFHAWPHVGIVCQAYLKESPDILARLITFAKKRGTPISIRLVKGAYWDYEHAHATQEGWPCPVFANKAETDANFEMLTQRLIHSFPDVRPCFGTHNARSLAVAMHVAEESGLQKSDIEFQMLYGMAEPFRDYVVSQGYRLRQYCPVGEFIPGMSYLVRRLLENTANQNFLRMHGREEVDVTTLIAPPNPADIMPDASDVRLFDNHPLLDFSQVENRARATTASHAFIGNLPVDVHPYIGGKQLKSRQTLTHTCPWDSTQKVSTVHPTPKKQLEEAISHAHDGLAIWRRKSAQERADILSKAADLAQTHWKELFALQVYEAGKDWRHADADIAEGIDFMRYYAEDITTLEGDFQPESLWGESNRTIYEPKGLVAVVAPWNFPFAISAGMTSAALAAGNAVLYKPAEQTSAIGQVLAEIYYAAGVPHNVFQFLPGKGEEIGDALIKHPDVNAIAFTGSQEVGLHILKEAATVRKGQNHLKSCVIEMGGKNAILVDSDADMDEAVPGVVHSAFGFQGQKCSACSRVIVIGDTAYKAFTARLKDVVEQLHVGPASDPINDVNAVIDEDAYKKITGYIKRGQKDGKLLAKAPKCTNKGHFIAPHVFVNLKKNSPLIHDEIFGPVLVVEKAKDINEALSMAQQGGHALTGGLFSRNPKTIETVRARFKVGNLYINRGCTGALVGRQPFGGGKLSGTGTKAGGPDYLLNFVEPRVITENTMRRGYAPREES